MKKLFVSVLIAVCLLTGITLSVSAATENGTQTAPAEMAGGGQNGAAELGQTDLAEPAPTDTGKDAEGNIFDELYEKIAACRSDLLSLFSCAASCLCLIFCKTGVFPFLQKGVSALSASALRMREDNEKQTAACDKLTTDLSGSLADMRNGLATLGARLEEMGALLPAPQDTAAEQGKLRAVLLSQVELLSEIFYASALPQYRKDEIGERVRAMKALLQTPEEAQ